MRWRSYVVFIAQSVTVKVAAVGLTFPETFMGILTDQWIVIGCGLLIGVLARAAYLLSMAKPVWRDFMISIIMAPMNGVLASELVESINLHDARLLLATSLLASTSTMVFVQARTKFIQKHTDPLVPAQVFTTPDATTHIPTNARPVIVTSVGSETPQTPAEIVIAELSKISPETDNGESLAALLHKLDKEPSK